MNDKTKEFIEKANKIHGDKYDYSKVNYINCDTKIIIYCKTHNFEFEQIPYSHVNKKAKCPKCAIDERANCRRKTLEQFINEAKIIHGSTYDYSKTTYINDHTKVIIICQKHGNFLQQPTCHLKGNGCKKCATEQYAKERTFTLNEFIERANIIHDFKYNYEKVKYFDSQTKVIIICNVHGEFIQLPNGHLQGRGCKKCGRFTTGTHLRKSKDDFIIEANNIHKNKYKYDLVKYVTCKIPVIIICPEHGKFEQTPSDHLSSRGCNECGKKQRALSQTFSKQDFINKANCVHNNKYNYSKVNYINSQTKIIIICEEHGEFLQKPNSHLQGYGCNRCAIIKNSNNCRYTTHEITKKFLDIFGNKFDYSKVEYKNSETPIEIICNKNNHHFMQLISNHLRYGTCPRCVRVLTLDDFIIKADKIHNNKYDYRNTIYVKTDISVIIICSIHGEFKRTPNEHLNGIGCTKCNLCSSCQLWRTFGKLCTYCEPLNKNKLFHKTKEMKIVNFLKQQLPENEFIHNKSVGSECTDGHLFPDIRFDCGYYNLIVEIDEHKHRGASYKCDKQRMYDIVAKLGLPCIFIRYNPDNKDSDENKLLKKVKKYLELDDNTIVWDDYGMKVKYMFYE